MRIFIESQCGLIDQLWSTALSPRCTPVLCGPRKCAASRDTQSVQIPPLLCTGGAASEYVEFWFALLEMIRIEHWIIIESRKIGARHVLKHQIEDVISRQFSGECHSHRAVLGLDFLARGAPYVQSEDYAQYPFDPPLSISVAFCLGKGPWIGPAGLPFFHYSEYHIFHMVLLCFTQIYTAFPCLSMEY